MSGTLFVVGTPIGNLDDMTYRAIKTLQEVDFITAEDTRVTLKLLNRFNIKNKLISYHDHSTKQVTENILDHIANGQDCAIVTDAGMPCISDPGEILVRMCYERGIPVKVIPGPSAVVSALAISGLNTSRFTFEGFLSVTKKQRFEHLEMLVDEPRTMIFYEAPHKLKSTLSDMYKYFGDRKISLCRELTKIHEEVLQMTLHQAIEYYELYNPKGEFVLVVEGKKADVCKTLSLNDAIKKVQDLVNNGARTTDACKEIAKISNFSKSELYTAVNNLI
ncbi:MAG: 16S rRNA (cytidine(1402)-2'-O)-methyltransferase [Ruminococcus sp.]|nr:16S rRNA (cytidine(1402)-2'-O)-methyltransferase [Ruminococcus sp.]